MLPKPLSDRVNPNPLTRMYLKMNLTHQYNAERVAQPAPYRHRKGSLARVIYLSIYLSVCEVFIDVYTDHGRGCGLLRGTRPRVSRPGANLHTLGSAPSACLLV